MPPALLRLRPLACAVSLVVLAAGVPAQAQGERVVVDAARTVGRSNDALLGVGWNTGEIERVAPLEPPLVRIDSRLESAAPAPGVIELATVLDKVARVRAIGGEPLVILFATPAWLGAERAATCTPDAVFFPEGCNPTLVAPSDLDAWQDLIAEVVRTLATAPSPAYRFEVWNEPDLPVFWHDTREAFLATAAATHRAVREVASATGLPIRIGGPGASRPEGVASYVESIAAAGLPLHFVSWHWYANYPFLGPDGAEGNIDPALYEALKGVNPDATPAVYGEQARDLRAELAPVLATAGLDPDFLIDEWNLSAGGLDRRHDSHEGAAFVAASLIEMERAGLDGAAYYRSNSDRELPGDWGLVDPEGRKKPAWWVFRAFEAATGDLLAVEGDDPAGGLWARASRSGGRIDMLVAAFRALGGSGRRVSLELRGCAAESARLARIDAGSPAWGRRQSLPVADGALEIELPDQSVAWLQLVCPRPAAPTGRCLTAGGAPRGAAPPGARRRPSASDCSELSAASR